MPALPGECWYPYDSVSLTLFSLSLFLRGSVLVAHAAIWVTTFAKRNIAQGHAIVVRVVVREGAWIVFLLLGQWSNFYYIPSTGIFTYFAGIVASQSAYAVVSDSSNPFAFFV